MTSKEYLDKLRHLDWLRGIAKDYRKHFDLIEREGNYFSVYGIQFSARSEPRMMNVNPNYFPRECIKEGLEVGLNTINFEIEELNHCVSLHPLNTNQL